MSKLLILIGVIFLGVPSVYANVGFGHSHGSFRNFNRTISDFKRSEDIEFRRSQERVFNRFWENMHHEKAEQAFFTLSINSESPRQIAYQYYTPGMQCFHQQDFAQSIALLTHAIEADPTFSAAYYFRGIVYFRLDEYNNALADMNKAGELRFNVNSYFINAINRSLARQNSIVYFSRGYGYMLQDNYAQAVIEFTQAIEKDPTYKTLYYCRGIAYFIENNFSNALIDINKAQQMGVIVSPVLIDAMNHRNSNIGVSYEEPNNYSQLIVDYTKAIALNPNDPKLYLKRGISYKKLQNYTLAIADYNKAIEIFPKYADAYRKRGACYYSMKEYTKAWADEMKAQDIGVIPNPGLMKALKHALGMPQ